MYCNKCYTASSFLTIFFNIGNFEVMTGLLAWIFCQKQSCICILTMQSKWLFSLRFWFLPMIFTRCGCFWSIWICHTNLDGHWMNFAVHWLCLEKNSVKRLFIHSYQVMFIMFEPYPSAFCGHLTMATLLKLHVLDNLLLASLTILLWNTNNFPWSIANIS